MTDPAVRMLLERLLWPVPRIRWEVARSVAQLIREGDRQASQALLDWIRTRQLESEAVLGLGIIEAFDLGQFFDFVEVFEAVRAPSHLSDLMLNFNFAKANNLSPFRYAVSPEKPSELPLEMESWFDRYRKWAVPEIFSYELEKLHETTGFPFIHQWKHEWRWLQATHQRPSADYPLYFSRGDRARRGQFDHGQRELYVSAYLRTLAYAAVRGVISHPDAEHQALLGLPLNRGLGDLQPMPRPKWAYNLRVPGSRDAAALSQKIWDSAADFCRSDETPIALKVTDVDKTDFVEFDMTMTIEPQGYDSSDEAALVEFSGLVTGPGIGRFSGQIGQGDGIHTGDVKRPLSLAQLIRPEHLGRAHIEIANDIRLASPRIFGTLAELACEASEVRLETQNKVFSRWVHWYADWEPTTFRELRSNTGSITTVSESSLDKLRMLVGVQLRLWTRVRRTVRSAPYRDYEVETQTFCI